MSLVPLNIQKMIILHAIILKKDDIGWKNIHFQMKNSKTFLKKTSYIFHYKIKFENAIRMPQVSLNDIFSIDEYGNYLDDMCDEIAYW